MVNPRPKLDLVTAGTAGPDFEQLFRDGSDGLFRTLYAFTGGRRSIAEDAVAEAFARAMALDTRPRDPMAWIYRTAFRIAIDEHRHERRFAPETNAAIDPPELHDLLGALRRLSPNQRAVIVLHHVEGFSLHEAANRMGIAAPTARVHLHRARAKLAHLLRDEEATS